MAEGNGDAAAAESRTPDYQKLVDYGVNEKVAVKIDDIYKTGECCYFSRVVAKFDINLPPHYGIAGPQNAH